MIDIHSHIIYGIDDGAKTIEDAMAMLDIAYNDGIRSIIATPHYHEYFRYEAVEMENRLQLITERFSEEKPEMKLYLGNECYLDENLLEDLMGGKCRTLAGSQYVLVEINYYTPTQMAKMMLRDIIDKGYFPIIAHCERLLGNSEDLRKIGEFKAIGCLFQINASIILRPQKKWLTNWTYSSLKDYTISFISTDSHDTIIRRPVLKEAYNIVRKKAGIEIANDVFSGNAQSIINYSNTSNP